MNNIVFQQPSAVDCIVDYLVSEPVCQVDFIIIFNYSFYGEIIFVG